MAIESDALAESLRRLASHPEQGEDLRTALGNVADACVEIFRVTGSGIMLADEQNITRYVASSDLAGRVLEEVESETGQGPCTQAFVLNRVVAVSDVRDTPQWPQFSAAMTALPVRAVLGVPVRLGAITVGTLDVYRDTPHDWEDGEREALTRFGEVITTDDRDGAVGPSRP